MWATRCDVGCEAGAGDSKRELGWVQLFAVGAYGGGAQVVREPRQAQTGLQHGGWDSVRTYRGHSKPLEAL
jgi:hypothetical protein